MPHLRMHPEGARDLVFRRHFNAPPARVFGRFTDAHWLKRWLGSDEAPLDEVIFEARAGGRLRYLWRTADGPLELTGTVQDIVPPHRVRHTERFVPDWTDGATEVTTRFDPEGQGTALTIRISYSGTGTRDRVLAGPMAEGMERHFVKLDQMLG